MGPFDRGRKWQATDLLAVGLALDGREMGYVNHVTG